MVIFTMRQFLSLTDAQKCRFIILILKGKAKIKEVEEAKRGEEDEKDERM